jgi:hypothetical protein
MRSRNRRLPWTLLLGLVTAPGLIASGCVNDPAAGGDTARASQRPREIELDRATPERQPDHPSAWLDGSGRVAGLPFFRSDVVILIDHSTLAQLASGVDVDRDGIVGRTRRSFTESNRPPLPSRSWTTDRGDTAHALQMRVARALVHALAARQNRLGLVSLTQRARLQTATLVRHTDKPSVVAPVGAPLELLLARIAELPAEPVRRRTDLTRLLQRGAELLDQATPSPGLARPRTLLLLSLGRTWTPDGIHHSSQQALAFAGDLGERDIAVWAVPFGVGGIVDVAYLDELTRSTGGAVVPLDQLEAHFGELDPSALRSLELENVAGRPQPSKHPDP